MSITAEITLDVLPDGELVLAPLRMAIGGDDFFRMYLDGVEIWNCKWSVADYTNAVSFKKELENFFNKALP